jgi:uncharacterized protein YdiU (UPF0061 family)
MLVGFIHGVMNTDNMTISGETIDYGPCAFMEAYDPATVFSSIDHGGRYAYGNQPYIAQWNLARLAETLLPLVDDDTQAAIDTVMPVLVSFGDRYESLWRQGMRTKLGLADDADPALVDDFLTLLQEQRVDFTSAFRSLSSVLRGTAGSTDTARALFTEDPAAFDAWATRWTAAAAARPERAAEIADAMDRANPIYIPRNHLVEEALAAATAGDVAPFERLVDVVSDPFTERPGLETYATPAPPAFCSGYRTFCGT